MNETKEEYQKLISDGYEATSKINRTLRKLRRAMLKLEQKDLYIKDLKNEINRLEEKLDTFTGIDVTNKVQILAKITINKEREKMEKELKHRIDAMEKYYEHKK